MVFPGDAGHGAGQRDNEDGDAEDEKDGQGRGANRLECLAGPVVLGRGCDVAGEVDGRQRVSAGKKRTKW